MTKKPCPKCSLSEPYCPGPEAPHVHTTCADCGEVFYTSAAHQDHVCLDLRTATRYVQELRLMNAQKNERIEALEDALIWCSGSPDFGPGGQAHEGWVKVCRPLLENQNRAV